MNKKVIIIIVILAIVLGAGAYYYFGIYLPKKKVTDLPVVKAPIVIPQTSPGALIRTLAPTAP